MTYMDITSEEEASLIEKCNFKCLTDCPLPPSLPCLWDDPVIGNKEYDEDPLFDADFPDFSWWRWDNEELAKSEPKDPTHTRCRRCLSVKVDIGYPYIKCKNCGYNEPLIDFPENVGCRG